MRAWLLLSLATLGRAPYAKQALWNSIRDGTHIIEFNAKIAAAAEEMITGDEPCSPCWPVVPDDGLDVRGLDGEASLESKQELGQSKDQLVWGQKSVRYRLVELQLAHCEPVRVVHCVSGYSTVVRVYQNAQPTD